ncbi:hypothetical protein LCGC14_1341340 [marine sediment metagenome]|uniref:Uncharacterized protein n=1 Tax=marine sediment metagenome TaxID=412755 RepID=A0A0F9KED8_9ZZZZ
MTTYLPVVLFRAKCFSRTPLHVIFGKHYEAVWESKEYKTVHGAMEFAKEQIEPAVGVWQLPGSKARGE